MSILYFLVPPLLLLGIPSKWFIQNTGRLPPLIALITFSALFLLYHLPFFIHFLFGRPDIHVIFKLGLFVFALLMWQPIANNKLKSAEKAKRYALLSGILLMPACLLFIVNGIINTEDGLGPFQTYRSLQLCISPEQMELIFPYQLKYDEIIGGITMLGLHKGSIVLTFKLGKIVKKDKETRKAK
jgi:putative membrane protein